jgi:dihydroorotate dehydrogenase electron transfer subunit
MHAEHRTASARGVFSGEVVANRPICREHFRLDVAVEGFPPTQPGQFVQVQCRPEQSPLDNIVTDWPADRPPTLTQPELRDVEPFLRRPISLAGRTDRGGRAELSFICRVVGTGTRWLAGVAEGERVSVLGPLGNAFAIRQRSPRAVLVGGGVGIPPLIYLAGALAAADKKTIALAGARSADLLPLTIVPGAKVASDLAATPCVAEFAAAAVPTIVATDDGSQGYRGLVSEAFSQWLKTSRVNAGEAVVYSCGPEAMMQAVAEACAAADVECQLALERHMACGMGTCQSCVVRTRTHDAAGWKYSLCCTDGPIFDARDVLW